MVCTCDFVSHICKSLWGLEAYWAEDGEESGAGGDEDEDDAKSISASLILGPEALDRSKGSSPSRRFSPKILSCELVQELGVVLFALLLLLSAKSKRLLGRGQTGREWAGLWDVRWDSRPGWTRFANLSTGELESCFRFGLTTILPLVPLFTTVTQSDLSGRGQGRLDGVVLIGWGRNGIGRTEGRSSELLGENRGLFFRRRRWEGMEGEVGGGRASKSKLTVL